MDQESQIRAPLEHPCYAGHFPGRPIVPGVLLLDLVVEAIGQGAPRALAAVKFHQAVLPGDALTVRWRREESRLSFRCERSTAGQPALVADGVLTL
ncbi:MAG TPA: hypothetical protein VMF52_04940 [Steroidobacteraceae bacterium]|nr:hypothetical protein [Steroidobacteraceae bacterium]